jgi:acyl-CoA synthetase (AMP-forming)/AMP-acid ligase II
MPTFLDKLETLAQKQPDDKAIVFSAEYITFRELWRNIELVSTNAYRLGYQPGDTFIFASKPTPKSISLVLGLVRAGLRVSFLDPFTAISSFYVRIGLVEPKFVIAESTLFTIGSNKSSLLRRLLKISIADFSAIQGVDFYFTGPRLPFLPKRARIASRDFLSPVGQVSSSGRVANSDSIIVFTSGTTAEPKGVVHSLESVSANFDETARIFEFKPGDRFHSGPITVGMVAMSSGATWFIPERKPNLTCNKYFAVPSAALGLMRELEAQGASKSSIEYFGMGGAPIPPSLVQRVIDVVGEDTRIPCLYGMTEILPVAFCDGREKFSNAKGDFLGQPIEGVEVRLASDSELEVRGSGLMKNYLGRVPEKWHPTGDLMKIDDHGNLLMLARKKNMMIRGEMNIYPSLYEPGITTIVGVQDAVMVGVPDEFEDDQIVLFILLDQAVTDSKQLRERIRSELPIHVDKEALPDQVVFLETMPLSGRDKKRDMTKLLEKARKELAEAK